MQTHTHEHSCHHQICIQNIILNNNISNTDRLYTRETIFDVNTRHISTDTYINFFHYSRWHELTGLTKFSLHVIYRGKGRIFLYAYPKSTETNTNLINNKNDCSPLLLASYSVSDTTSDGKLNIELEDKYDFFFFAWEDEVGSPLLIKKAYYSVDIDFLERNINIAIVSTTFRRLEDIKHLINIYLSTCNNNLDFKTSSHLFIINNEYADRNALSLYNNSNITIINNKENFGGAGGFAHGARLAVEQGGFTHVLFMDDDALIHEESWFRSLALLRCIRDDLCDHPISGAMFTREHPTYCHAMIEALNKDLHRQCLSGAAYLDSPEVCKNFLISAHDVCCQIRDTKRRPPYPYAAWWYCLFPTSVFVQHGYPAPYFFCGDDIEYGLRIKKSPLFLNGICVWHPAFENKGSPLREYLSLRNHALRCAVYMKSWRYILIKTFFKKMARCLAANDYERGAVTILALHDFMNFANVPREGSQLINRVETERQRWTNNKEPMPYIPIQVEKKSLRHNVLPMFCVFLTLGGALIPPFLRHRCTVSPFLQVGERWASQCTAYPGEKDACTLQTLKAIKLTLAAFRGLVKILCTRSGTIHVPAAKNRPQVR